MKRAVSLVCAAILLLSAYGCGSRGEASSAEPVNSGTLAYYEPWADVVMYYAPFGQGSGLYELGRAVSGRENIEKLSGAITITAVE